MKVKLNRTSGWIKTGGFSYNLLFGYIGKSIKTGRYQIGCGFGKYLPTLYINSVNKPKIKNLALINAILIVPCIIYSTVKVLFAILLMIIVALQWVTYKVYFLADYGFGDDSEHVAVIAFWQIISIILAYNLIF